MVRCLRVGPPPSYAFASVELDQGKIHEALGGKITFVGAIPHVGAFIVARKECGEGSQMWEEGRLPPSLFCLKQSWQGTSSSSRATNKERRRTSTWRQPPPPSVRPASLSPTTNAKDNVARRMFLVDARASTLVWHDKEEDVRHDFGLLCDMPLSSAASSSLEWECSHAPIMEPKLNLYSNMLPGQLLSQHFHWKHRIRTSTVHQPSAQKVISKWRAEPHRWTQAVARLSKWKYSPKRKATFADPESCQAANAKEDEERRRLRSFADAIVFNSALLTLTHFRASVAAHLCRTESARHVLDFSAGWGDRLTGFLSSPCVESITLVDPRGGSIRACKRQHSFVGSKQHLITKQGPAEEVLPTLPSQSYDLILTSPPYYDLECYGETEAEARGQIRSRVDSLDGYHSPPSCPPSWSSASGCSVQKGDSSPSTWTTTLAEGFASARRSSTSASPSA